MGVRMHRAMRSDRAGSLGEAAAGLPVATTHVWELGMATARLAFSEAQLAPQGRLGVDELLAFVGRTGLLQ